ncbi:MAG: YdcF family protein [Alphaproteobacteria bacterium]|nr:YdcF family protein [Alphaproteobacteria bacterium]
MVWLGRMIGSLALCAGAWLAGLVWFAAQIPSAPAPADAKAAAIVALTGGKGRLEEGFQRLAAGSAPVLFISGVGDDVRVIDLLRPLPDALQTRLRALPKSSIVLGHHARNTIGNAEETMRWLSRDPKSSILLVTSDYHMPRSLSEFSSLMPSLAITPVPVLADASERPWWSNDGSRELVLSEYHKFLASKIRHWLVLNTEQE